jgi:hypothetical protein
MTFKSSAERSAAMAALHKKGNGLAPTPAPKESKAAGLYLGDIKPPATVIPKLKMPSMNTMRGIEKVRTSGKLPRITMYGQKT